MEEFYKIGAEYEFMDSLCNTIFDVKLRYYELLRAKALLKVAQENVNLNEKFLILAKNKEKSDLKTAELNLSAAKIDLIEAKNNYKNSIFDMNNTMYIETKANYTLKDTPTFSSKFNFDSENLKLNDFSRRHGDCETGTDQQRQLSSRQYHPDQIPCRKLATELHLRSH